MESQSARNLAGTSPGTSRNLRARSGTSGGPFKVPGVHSGTLGGSLKVVGVLSGTSLRSTVGFTLQMLRIPEYFNSPDLQWLGYVEKRKRKGRN